MLDVSSSGRKITKFGSNSKGICRTSSSPVLSGRKQIMPRRRCAGCFNNLPCIQKEELPVENDLLDLTSMTLELFTDQFSPDNLIGGVQFQELYRGKMSAIGFDQRKITKDVAIKNVFYGYWRAEKELKFLQDPKIRGNPNLPKVIGCCREDDMIEGLVYDLKPHCTLHHLITRDDFKWLQRVNTALALAHLLNYLHDRKSPYLIRNFDPYHIVVDQNFTPILFEFGMLTGGILGKQTDEADIEEVDSLAYIDPSVTRCTIGYGVAPWTVKSDVYSFGIVLSCLISKRVIDKKNVKRAGVHLWAPKVYKPGCSLVHQSLEADPDFDPRDGPKITELAMQCTIADHQMERPLMKEVVKRLKALHVVQQRGDKISSFYRR